MSDPHAFKSVDGGLCDECGKNVIAGNHLLYLQANAVEQPAPAQPSAGSRCPTCDDVAVCGDPFHKLLTQDAFAAAVEAERGRFAGVIETALLEANRVGKLASATSAINFVATLFHNSVIGSSADSARDAVDREHKYATEYMHAQDRITTLERQLAAVRGLVDKWSKVPSSVVPSALIRELQAAIAPPPSGEVSK